MSRGIVNLIYFILFNSVALYYTTNLKVFGHILSCYYGSLV